MDPAIFVQKNLKLSSSHFEVLKLSVNKQANGYLFTPVSQHMTTLLKSVIDLLGPVAVQQKPVGCRSQSVFWFQTGFPLNVKVGRTPKEGFRWENLSVGW